MASKVSNYRMSGKRVGAEPVKPKFAHIFVADFLQMEAIAIEENVSVAAVIRKAIRLGLPLIKAELDAHIPHKDPANV